MPSPVPPEVKGRILALSAQNYSRSMIVRELGKQNLKVSEVCVQYHQKPKQWPWRSANRGARGEKEPTSV
jgi:hypothetical protein